MWPFHSIKPRSILLFFTNTLSGKKELFIPHHLKTVRLYSCGPTVYGPVQIGNLRSFVLADITARVVELAGYKVQRVMNITDVGHMVGDVDEGEDKMNVGATRENTTPKAIADRYTALFMEDIKKLGIETSAISFPRATDYVQQDIEMIRTLEKKGFTYRTSEGVYFDTSKFPSYGKLLGVRNAELRAGARVALGEKKSPSDFVLWRFAKPHDLQKWNSPWGEGNPGWSIECSVMSATLLGKHIDIHTGGEDLAPIHHNNEIAQSECATGTHPFVRYWVHGAFLTIDGEKLSKSAGNSFTLSDVVARGFNPLALRYLFLQAHYRSPLSFSWEALQSAEEALTRLWRSARMLKTETGGKGKESHASATIKTTMMDDLATPQALAQVWESMSNSALSAHEKWRVLETAEKVLGLSLTNPPNGPEELPIESLPPEVQSIARKREEARKNKDFAVSDELRIHLQERGYHVEDTPSHTIYTLAQK